MLHMLFNSTFPIHIQQEIHIHGNIMTHNDKLHEIEDNGSLTTIFDLMELYITVPKKLCKVGR